ncbi:hypothetical protein DI09_6p280 [Mitosporidium daphniae]|uniref:Mitochondrial carrier protein n=1 Tax=Mitosporidium daphniae TaxID=1485682 RepID=A0A098VNT9_9MICR|nr:uncharacterized protein DI09_6p280 [Mitosporidium daphniae]KGG50444.1 hypothetical protein DI09_6p280 [Mitosporidium daphniae]|eukprot:XP_013236871.1 uncharacterized protein DI09_6p280 [Mitosporidium daphniae]
MSEGPLAENIFLVDERVANGVAGLAIGHPFDTVKVRMQNNIGNDLYGGSMRTFLKIVKEEKIRGLFKGIIPPMIGVGLVNAFVFGVYGTILNSIQAAHVGHHNSLLPFFVAGACSGFANSFITGPFELAKCLQQQSSIGVRSSAQSKLPGTFSILREAYRRWGISGPCRGLLATIIRDTPSFGTYFLAYEAIMLHGGSSADGMSKNQDLYTKFETYVEQYGSHTYSPIITCPSIVEKPNSSEYNFPPLLLTLFAGAASGVLSWLVTYPFDVIKTRIQSTPLDVKTTGIIQTYKAMCRQTGIASLFCGLNVTLLRAIPTNAVTFLGFSLALNAFESKW